MEANLYKNNKESHELPKIVCFIHSCTINNWKEILFRQLNRLCTSGLYEKLDGIYLNIATEEMENFEIPDFLRKFSKLQIKLTRGLERYERSTLEWLNEFCQSCTENVHILYLHSKGVSRYKTFHEPYVKDWINLMETILIDNHSTCLKYLEKVDTCSVNFLPLPSPHFSGNFWWGNSDYIKQLNHEIGPDYLSPELWILTNDHIRFCCIFHSNINHYHEPFPSEKIPSTFQPIYYIKNNSGIRVLE